MTRKRESGNILLFTALGLVVLMGFAGLAIDGGMMKYQKRLQQTAADAAAIAGATDLAYGSTGSQITTAGQSAAAANGFTDGASANCVSGGGVGPDGSGNAPPIGTVCVAVNNPPSYWPSDPQLGDKNYVEVVVTEVHQTYFMNLLKIPSTTVVARAEATDLSGGTSSSNCLYTLGPPAAAIEGINITGSATLNAPTCGISDDGNYDPTGGTVNLIINAGSFGAVGTDTGHGGNVTCYSQPKPCPAYGAPTQPDPESALTAPTQPAASTSCPSSGLCTVSTSGTTTLNPGTYASIKFGKNSTTTLNPGLYYINNADGSGGLTFDGKATVAGSGVMFYLTCPPGTTSFPCANGATIGATGGGNVPDINLTAMTTAQSTTYTGTSAYADILFYQNANDTATPTLGGDDSSAFNGVLYFPSVELTFFGNSHSTQGFTAGVIIAKALAMTGNPTITVKGLSGLPSPLPSLSNAILVE